MSEDKVRNSVGSSAVFEKRVFADEERSIPMRQRYFSVPEHINRYWGRYIKIYLSCESDLAGLSQAIGNLPERRKYYDVILCCPDPNSTPEWTDKVDEAKDFFVALGMLNPKKLSINDFENFPIFLLEHFLESLQEVLEELTFGDTVTCDTTPLPTSHTATNSCTAEAETLHKRIHSVHFMPSKNPSPKEVGQYIAALPTETFTLGVSVEGLACLPNKPLFTGMANSIGQNECIKTFAVQLFNGKFFFPGATQSRTIAAVAMTLSKIISWVDGNFHITTFRVFQPLNVPSFENQSFIHNLQKRLSAQLHKGSYLVSLLSPAETLLMSRAWKRFSFLGFQEASQIRQYLDLHQCLDFFQNHFQHQKRALNRQMVKILTTLFEQEEDEFSLEDNAGSPNIEFPSPINAYNESSLKMCLHDCDSSSGIHVNAAASNSHLPSISLPMIESHPPITCPPITHALSRGEIEIDLEGASASYLSLMVTSLENLPFKSKHYEVTMTCSISNPVLLRARSAIELFKRLAKLRLKSLLVQDFKQFPLFLLQYLLLDDVQIEAAVAPLETLTFHNDVTFSREYLHSRLLRTSTPSAPWTFEDQILPSRLSSARQIKSLNFPSTCTSLSSHVRSFLSSLPVHHLTIDFVLKDGHYDKWRHVFVKNVRLKLVDTMSSNPIEKSWSMHIVERFCEVLNNDPSFDTVKSNCQKMSSNEEATVYSYEVDRNLVGENWPFLLSIEGGRILVDLSNSLDFNLCSKELEACPGRYFFRDFLLTCRNSASIPDWEQPSVQAFFTTLAKVRPRTLSIKDFNNFPLFLLEKFLICNSNVTLDSLNFEDNIRFNVSHLQLANSTSSPQQQRSPITSISVKTSSNEPALVGTTIGRIPAQEFYIDFSLSRPIEQFKFLGEMMRAISSNNVTQKVVLRLSGLYRSVLDRIERVSGIVLHMVTMLESHSSLATLIVTKSRRDDLYELSNTPHPRQLPQNLIAFELFRAFQVPILFSNLLKVLKSSNETLCDFSIFGFQNTAKVRYFLELNRRQVRSNLREEHENLNMIAWLHMLTKPDSPQDKTNPVDDITHISCLYHVLRQHPFLVSS